MGTYVPSGALVAFIFLSCYSITTRDYLASFNLFLSISTLSFILIFDLLFDGFSYYYFLAGFQGFFGESLVFYSLTFVYCFYTYFLIVFGAYFACVGQDFTFFGFSTAFQEFFSYLELLVEVLAEESFPFYSFDANLTDCSLAFYLEIGFLTYFYYFFSFLSYFTIFLVFSYLSTFSLIGYLALFAFTISYGFFESLFELDFFNSSPACFLSSFFVFSFTSSVCSTFLVTPLSLFFFCFSYFPLACPI